jgi:hypothetical protein
LLALAIVTGLGTAPQIYRAPWRVVGQFLNRNMRPGDLAVIHSRVGTRVYDFYVNRPDVPRRGVDAPAVPVSLPMVGMRVWHIMWDYAYTAQEMMGRAPWRIERRILVPGVMAMELTDEPWPDGMVGYKHEMPFFPQVTPASQWPSLANLRPTSSPAK